MNKKEKEFLKKKKEVLERLHKEFPGQEKLDLPSSNREEPKDGFAVLEVSQRTPKGDKPWLPYKKRIAEWYNNETGHEEYGIENITLRRILPDEISLDCDDCNAKEIHEQLKKWDLSHTWWSTKPNKPHTHAHIRFRVPQLKKFKPHVRTEAKKWIIKQIRDKKYRHADLCCAHPCRMISIEWSKHHKRNEHLELIKEYEGNKEIKFPKDLIEKFREQAKRNKDIGDIMKAPSISVKWECPLIERIMKEGIPGNVGTHRFTWYISAYLKNKGYSLKETQKFLKDWNKKNHKKEPKSQIKNQSETVYKNGVDHITCRKIREQDFPFAEKCKNCKKEKENKERFLNIVKLPEKWEEKAQDTNLEKVIKNDRINYGAIKTLPKSEINIGNLVYEGVDKHFNPSLYVDKKYRIYKCSVGKGHAPIYVITKPNNQLTSGIDKLCLKKIGRERFIDEYHKKEMSHPPILEKQGKEEFSTLFDIMEEGRVFEVKNTINQKVINHIFKNGNSKVVENIFNDFFYMNGKIDKNIYFVLRSKLISTTKVKPKFQKYQDHTLIVDSGKTGKSTLCEKFCKCFGSATGSRMTGYGTGDRVFSGSLDGQFKTILFDDINTDNYKEGLLNAIPNLMEQGKVRIGKGAGEVLTRSSSPFILTTNVELLGHDISKEDLLIEFEEVIKKLGNPIRVGSRFGIVLFSDELEEAKKTNSHLFDRDLEKNKELVNIVSNKLSKLFEELLENTEIQKLVNEPIKELEIIREESKSYGTGESFWYQMTKGFRHINGGALKHAILDYIIEDPEAYITEEIEIERLKKLFRKNRKEIININLKSFQNILQTQKSQKKIILKRLSNIPKYQFAIIYAFSKLKNDKNLEKLTPIEMIQDYLEGDFDKYSNVSGILQVLNSVSIGKINRNLEDFGVRILEKNGNYFIEGKETVVNLVNLVTEFSNPEKIDTEGPEVENKNLPKNGKLVNLDNYQKLLSFTKNGNKDFKGTEAKDGEKKEREKPLPKLPLKRKILDKIPQKGIQKDDLILLLDNKEISEPEATKTILENMIGEGIIYEPRVDFLKKGMLRC